MKYLFLFFSILLFSCSNNDDTQKQPDPQPVLEEIRGADLSFLPEAEAANVVYKFNQQSQSPLITLKNKGANYIRLRIWHQPSGMHSSLAEVKTMAQRIKQAGMKVWLTVHYSDTWADPGQQQLPAAWQNLNFSQILSEATAYTQLLLQEIQPDLIQIGNEINVGLLHPHGHLIQQKNQCIQLLQSIAQAIRTNRPNCKIMLHYAGLNGSNWFFDQVKTVDYDYMGLSYYPIWHGQSLTELSQTIANLSSTYQKKIVLAEVAYPFTLSWNDWTNNIVGLSNQLVPNYPATPQGQKDYLLAIKNLKNTHANYLGFCYWGTEWVSFYGNQATNGSSWENQALWDFNGNALPALDAFNP
ncbi:MAG: arabinogalactan endo-beta-1,4-galactanase [Flavobacterium sp.]